MVRTDLSPPTLFFQFHLQSRGQLLNDVWPVEIVHRAVKAREDSRGEEDRYIPLEEVSILGFTDDDFVIKRHVFPILGIHCKALEVNQPCKANTNNQKLWFFRLYS